MHSDGRVDAQYLSFFFRSLSKLQAKCTLFDFDEPHRFQFHAIYIQFGFKQPWQMIWWICKIFLYKHLQPSAWGQQTKCQLYLEKIISHWQWVGYFVCVSLKWTNNWIYSIEYSISRKQACIEMEQLLNCYSQKPTIKTIIDFCFLCVCVWVCLCWGSRNDLMKRLICLIDTLIDSLRHLFRLRQQKKTIILISKFFFRI